MVSQLKNQSSPTKPPPLNTSPKKTKHGGERPGAGRHPGPPTQLMRIRLPIPLYEKVEKLGGDVWVKEVIKTGIAEVEKEASQPS